MQNGFMGQPQQPIGPYSSVQSAGARADRPHSEERYLQVWADDDAQWTRSTPSLYEPGYGLAGKCSTVAITCTSSNGLRGFAISILQSGGVGFRFSQFCLCLYDGCFCLDDIVIEHRKTVKSKFERFRQSACSRAVPGECPRTRR